MIRTLAALVALLVVGCSKPAEVVVAPATDAEPSPLLLDVAGQRTPHSNSSEGAIPIEMPSLPKSKAEAVAELTSRGLTLEPFGVSVPIPGVTGYRLRGAPLGIGFTEHDGKLREVEAMALAGTAEKNPVELRGFAATVGEVATGLPRGGVLQVIDSLLADVGSSPRGFNRTVDDGKQRINIDVRRHDDGGYSFKFTAEPNSRR